MAVGVVVAVVSEMNQIHFLRLRCIFYDERAIRIMNAEFSSDCVCASVVECTKSVGNGFDSFCLLLLRPTPTAIVDSPLERRYRSKLKLFFQCQITIFIKRRNVAAWFIIMRNIKILYQKALKMYPMSTQAVQSGILMGLGDQIAQNFIDNSKTIDLVRTMQFTGIGFFISGPATRTWYGILDKYIGSKGYSVAIRKVVYDQLLFAPTFTAVLLVTIGICQGKNIEKLKIKIQNEYSDILMNNYKLWPMVQLVNFSLVPLHYQVLVVQVVALFWNSYISYKTNLNI